VSSREKSGAWSALLIAKSINNLVVVIPRFFLTCNASESYAWRDYPFAPSLYDVPMVLSRCDVRYDVVVSNDWTRAEEKLTVVRVQPADLR